MYKLINMFRYVENVLFMSGLCCKKIDFLNKTNDYWSKFYKKNRSTISVFLLQNIFVKFTSIF